MHNVDSDKLSQTNSANRGHSEGLRHSVPSPACGQGNRIWVNKYESLTERTESKSSEIPVLFTHMRLPCACGGGLGWGHTRRFVPSPPPPSPPPQARGREQTESAARGDHISPKHALAARLDPHGRYEDVPSPVAESLRTSSRRRSHQA